MTSPAPPNTPWMTREEAAEYLRFKPRTVDRLVREGKLTRFHTKHGGHPRFRRTEVYALIEIDDRVGDPSRAPQKAIDASLRSRGILPVVVEEAS